MTTTETPNIIEQVSAQPTAPSATSVGWLPLSPPRSLLHGAFLASFVLLLIYDNRNAEAVYPPALRFPLLDSITYWLDPFLVQLCALGVCAVLWGSYLRDLRPGVGHMRRWLVAVVAPSSLLVFAWVLEVCVLKPSFSYARPEPTLGDPWLTQAIRDVLAALTAWMREGTRIDLAVASSKVQDVPSGFAVRQFLLFYLTFWIAQQPAGQVAGSRGPWLSRPARKVVHIWNVAAVLFVCLSRLYRLRHTLFSVTVAAGVSTFIFFAVVALAYGLAPRYRDKHRYLLPETIAAYSALTLAFFFYSNHTEIWLILTVIVYAVLALAYTVPRAVSRPPKATGGRSV